MKQINKYLLNLTLNYVYLYVYVYIYNHEYFWIGPFVLTNITFAYIGLNMS